MIKGEKEGVVLQSSPFRIVRVNGTAFEILQRCRAGFYPEEFLRATSAPTAATVLSFLDSLSAMQLLEWTPDEDIEVPFVSIIIPVYNRAGEISDCLESLAHLNYPHSRREIIVVDDASEDNTAEVVQGFGVGLIVQKRNGGQSAARNAGVAVAKGEIIAFIDSDCIADSNWLRELVPYFQDPRIALVGGYVASHFRKTWLDRYEDAKSPLNMGRAALTCNRTDSDFYVPTCNMLVRKGAYLEVGGLDESWRVGEDVDLCWKLKKRHHRLVYVPEGRVRHRHRNRFLETFNRRFDYGTSEPILYERHREVAKRFPFQPAGLLFSLCCLLGLLTRPLSFALFSIAIVLAVAIKRREEIRNKTRLSFAFREIFQGAFKNCTYMLYHLSMHFVRYYLLLFIPFTLLVPSAILPFLGVMILTASVEFARTRPCVPFPLFVCFFLIEQAFYQAGVLSSCLKLRSFRCYRLCFIEKRQGLWVPVSQRIRDFFTKRWSEIDLSRRHL